MIPACEPYLDGNELKYISDCVNNNWISSKGEYVDKFESGFARYCGCDYGISTTSGTAALHLALATLGIGKGDEVIIPTFTMVSTLLSVLYTGATPILIDCEPDTHNINVDKIEEKISTSTRCIMPVHIYGHPCNMDLIIELSLKYNIPIVEDAAEAHGAKYRGRRAGGLSDIGCFSFYANKVITTGEGGMVVTNNKEYAARARNLKNLAYVDGIKYWHQEVGFNYRMTNLQAALGLAQLEKIDEYIKKRRKNASLYNYYLKDVTGVELPVELPWIKSIYWMYAIKVPCREFLTAELLGKGIETRPFFIPMHKQPFFENGGSYPISDEISRSGLCLPSGTGLKEKDIEYICNCIKEIL